MAFDSQPYLRGKLVELRPLTERDYRDLYAAAADPAIWEQHPDRDRHREAVFERYFRDALASRGTLTVRDCENGRVIGSSRYHCDHEHRSEIEIGWTFLARSHWGGAYNGELKHLMLGHAFRSIETVVFLVAPQNVRSQCAIERIGGVRSGWRPDATGRPNLIYRIEARDWLEQTDHRQARPQRLPNPNTRSWQR